MTSPLAAGASAKKNYNRLLIVVAGHAGLLYGLDLGIIAGCTRWFTSLASFCFCRRRRARRSKRSKGILLVENPAPRPEETLPFSTHGLLPLKSLVAFLCVIAHNVQRILDFEMPKARQPAPQ